MLKKPACSVKRRFPAVEIKNIVYTAFLLQKAKLSKCQWCKIPVLTKSQGSASPLVFLFSLAFSVIFKQLFKKKHAWKITNIEVKGKCLPWHYFPSVIVSLSFRFKVTANICFSRLCGGFC